MREDGAGNSRPNATRGRDRTAKQHHERGQKASFQWINSQIIAASENGGIPQLMSAVMAHLPRMNLVNLSTAVHRIAKLTSNDMRAQEDIRQNPVLDELLRTILSVLCMIDANDAQPQSLSNVAWSLATMRLMNRPLVKIVVSLAVTNIARFKPFELSTMLWALAKLTTLDQSSWFMKPIFQASAALVIDEVHQFSFRCLATTAWAFATAKQRNSRLFRSIAAQMMPMVRVANCQELANAAWAFATADFHDEQLFGRLAESAIPRLEEFKPQELSNMLWGFATNGFFHEAFFTRASVTVQHMPLQSQHLANILWAFVRARPHHPVTTATILMLLPSCTRQLETFKPQEVSSTALAIAKAFATGDDLEYHAHHHVALPSQVTEFFKYAMPWTLPRLREFSAQSLANTVSAFAMVRTPGDVSLFLAVGKEVHERYHSLEPTALLHLLKGFTSAPQELCGDVVKFLAKVVSCHIENFRPQEMQTLSRICISLLKLNRNRDLSSDELRSCCASIANNAMLDIPLLPEEGPDHLNAFERLAGHFARPHIESSYSSRGLCDSSPHSNGTSLTLGKVLALENVLSESFHGISAGNLPSMPANALYESDFHFTGRPPSPKTVAVHRDHAIASAYDYYADTHASMEDAASYRELSPHNRQIGMRSEIHPSASSSGQKSWKSRKDARRNPKAIRNQRMDPINYQDLSTISEGRQNSMSASPVEASIPVPVAMLMNSEMPMTMPDQQEEYDAQKEFQWKFTIKNSFFHVGARDGVEGVEEEAQSVDDGASQRSSSVPNRARPDRMFVVQY